MSSTGLILLVLTWGPCAAALPGPRNQEGRAIGQSVARSSLRTARCQGRSVCTQCRLLAVSMAVAAFPGEVSPIFSSVFSISSLEIPNPSQYVICSCISRKMCDTISADWQASRLVGFPVACGYPRLTAAMSAMLLALYEARAFALAKWICDRGSAGTQGDLSGAAGSQDTSNPVLDNL